MKSAMKKKKKKVTMALNLVAGGWWEVSVSKLFYTGLLGAAHKYKITLIEKVVKASLQVR